MIIIAVMAKLVTLLLVFTDKSSETRQSIEHVRILPNFVTIIPTIYIANRVTGDCEGKNATSTVNYCEAKNATSTVNFAKAKAQYLVRVICIGQTVFIKFVLALYADFLSS